MSERSLRRWKRRQVILPAQRRLRRRQLLAALASGAFLIGLLAIIWQFSIVSKESAVLSCLASAHSSLERLGDPQIKQIAKPVEEWQPVGDGTADRLFTLARARPCGGIDPDGPLLDRWDHRIRLSIREKISVGKIEFLLISDGRDGTPGTADDISFPRP